MIATTPLDELWGALAEEADEMPFRRPNFSEAHTTQARACIKTKMVKAWLSGYIPVTLLLMWFSKGYLVVAAPILAWIVVPLARGKHGLTPIRLLLLSIPIVLVPTAYIHRSRIFSDLDPRAPMRDTYMTVSYAEVFVGLLLVAALLVLTYLAREHAPWFEQTSSSKIRHLGAWLFIGVPLVIIGLFLEGQFVDDSIKRWEREVLAQNPHLAQLRLVHYGLEPWRRLDNRSRGPLRSWNAKTLRPEQVAMLRDFEGQARRLYPRRSLLDKSADRSAQSVFAGLLRHLDYLEKPMEVLATLETLRMRAGTPLVAAESFEEHCVRRLSEKSVALSTLISELQLIENLIAECPTSVVQNDRRWFAQRESWLRPDLSFLNLDRIRQEKVDLHNIESWLLVRPAISKGSTLDQLKESENRDIGWAAERLSYREAFITHEGGAKPFWQFYALAYRLRIHQLQTGDYPENIGQLGLSEEIRDRYEWTGGTLKTRAKTKLSLEWVSP